MCSDAFQQSLAPGKAPLFSARHGLRLGAIALSNTRSGIGYIVANRRTARPWSTSALWRRESGQLVRANFARQIADRVNREEAKVKRTAVDELLDALRTDKPAILFLGQDYVRLDEGCDPVLRSFIDRRTGQNIGLPKWRDAFQDRPIQDLEYEWLSERFDRSVQSERMERVFDLAWSAVFTSSIDPKISQRMETRGRVPEPVLAKDHFARASRSKARPAIHFLFGRSGDTNADVRPPRSLLELKRRYAMHAAAILNRLGDTATPLGVVVIDGYDALSDWLELDQLLAPISNIPGPRVLWFGSEGSGTDSVFLAQMELDGMLVREARGLAQALTEEGIPVDASRAVFHVDVGTVSLGDGKFLQLHSSVRLRTEAAAAVVDDTWTDPAPIPAAFQIEESFRRFHGDFGGPRSMVEGVGQGYAIVRDFEERLRLATASQLASAGELENFLVLHGQSGVGKSVALARLARELRIRSKIPVLYASGRVPTAVELDDFCDECERAGALGTVIICDGGQSFERYRDLTVGLKSRGRRIVVVGSSYRVEEPRLLADERFIEAPEILSASEASKLHKLLLKFGGPDMAELNIERSGEHFLALLYRYLTVSRTRLAKGVASEARFTEGTIRLRARAVPQGAQAPTLLAQKLIEAGLTNSPTAIFDDDVVGATQGSDAAAKLVDYVMAAGRLDCAVPINLVIRALRSKDDQFDPTQIGYLFGELDLFRWKALDAEGSAFAVQPRLQLEAELICRKRMGDFGRELDCLLALIGAVRPTSVDERSEVQFLLDLLHKLHRDGPRKMAYRAGYLGIARALTTLREQHHVIDASLMLQESAFRREALFAADKPDEVSSFIPDADRDEILEEAREVIELALRGIAEGQLRAGRRSRQNFAVERASIYGFLAVGSAKRGAPEEQIWSQYLAARTAVNQAMSAADNHFPLDIGLWAPADIVQATSLSEVHKAEMQADMLAFLDRGRADAMPPQAAERFRMRQLKVAPLVERIDLADEAYAYLEKNNAPVAYFLKARDMCKGIFESRDVPVSEEDRSIAKSAAKFLDTRRLTILSDARCLQLLLQLKWVATTGERIFGSERCLIPTERESQQELLETVSALNQAAGEGSRNTYRLLEAALEWIRGDASQARELFRSLAHDSEFEDSTRVTRRLLHAGDDQGFRGMVTRQRSEGHWTLQVDGFSNTIDLLTRDFPNEDIRVGRELRRFNIAFNYLGPIADPLLRRGGRP